MKQYLFYQHNVQQFFIRHLDKFDGVIVPLSIATSFPDGTHGFLQALFAKDPQKQFVIDPRSPLFQKSWNRNNVRDPHRKMAEVFGPPFSTAGLSSKVGLLDLSVEALQSITTAAIEYQQKFRLRKQEQKKIDKYKKLLGVSDLPQIANPQLLVPPYFQFASIGDPWYGASMVCLNGALTSGVHAEDLRPILHFAGFDDIGDYHAAINLLLSMGIRSAFLYPNDFREHQATTKELQTYAEVVKAFSLAGIQPYALHGGYFAICLSRHGLRGFGNGVGYGEWRDSGYHRGGTAEKRIYIPKLHRFLEPAKAQLVINADPDHFASDSDLLAECVASKRPLDAISLEEALDHFLDTRRQELEFVKQHPIEEILRKLSETIVILENLGELERSFARSLSSWRDALRVDER